MKALALSLPEARFIARTEAPAWLFHSLIEVQPLQVDTGVAQIDSLHLDEEETARRAADFYSDFDERSAAEADYLRRIGASVVLCDMPPLGFAAAREAGLPSVAIGNFTWDWIYAAYPAFDTLAPSVIPLVSRAYRSAALALRLPMHGGFDAMHGVVRDIPFIARRATRGTGEVRRLLDVADGSRFVLTSFGSYGLRPDASAFRGRANADALPLSHSDRTHTWSFGRQLPPGLSYEDLVAAADVVVSKPGYGIISDCLANHTPLLYTSRGHFIEYDVLTAEMPRMLKSRYISQEDLMAGRWEEAIDALLAQPEPPERARVDGAAIAADAIASLTRAAAP